MSWPLRGLGHLKTSEVGDVLERAVRRMERHLRRPGGVVTLWAFDLDRRGDARRGRVMYDFGGGRGIDGMALDEAGRIWATAGTKDKAGIYVFAPDAKRATAGLTMIPTPEDPTNCTFGGPRRDILYVTTTSSLYRIQTAVRGQPSPPGK